MIWQLLDARTFSGIEKHVEVMCEGLNAKGVDCQIVLLTAFNPHPFRERLIAKNIPHLVLEGGFSALRKAVKFHKPTLIHTHGYKAGIMGRWTGVPVVSTFHAGERGKFPVSLYQWIDEKTAFKAKQTFAVSKQVQARVKGSVVLDNFVPVKALCTKTSLPPVVAFVGRLSHEKGPDIFCEIAAKMQNKGLIFKMYGDGAMRPELEKKYGHLVDFKGFTGTMENDWVAPYAFSG
jgi:glycosyltransferase involved in cell wall biosynthesis